MPILEVSKSGGISSDKIFIIILTSILGSTGDVQMMYRLTSFYTSLDVLIVALISTLGDALIYMLLDMQIDVNDARRSVRRADRHVARGIILIFSKMVLGIGEYPAGYNAHVHGPYDPARYYGKPDTKFTDVKLGDMTSWLKRRNYNPMAIGRGLGRGYWRWYQTWVLPKKAGPAALIQGIMAVSLFYYINQYPHIKYHKHCKYH